MLLFALRMMKKYIAISISAGEECLPLLSGAIIPHAMGHHFIYLCSHSGISKSPLSLPTAIEMTLIEEKVWSSPKKHHFDERRSWSRIQFQAIKFVLMSGWNFEYMLNPKNDICFKESNAYMKFNSEKSELKHSGLT